MEVFDGGVAATAVQIAHKGRAVGWCKHRVLATDEHAVGRVARMLRELAWRCGLHQAAAQAAREAHPLPFHIGAGGLEQRQGFSIIPEINAGFLQDGVCIAFNDLQTFFVKHLVVGDFARDVGYKTAASRRPCGPLGFAPAARSFASRGLYFGLSVAHKFS